MSAPSFSGGLLLCRAAGHPVAFPASHVVSVETWSSAADGFPHARAAFGQTPERGRALISESGEAVGVDAVEVCSEPQAYFRAPEILAAAAGGSLRGFAEAKSELWPVHDLVAFARYLSGKTGGLL